MTVTQAQYETALARLVALHEESLKKHDAFDMWAYNGCVAYVKGTEGAYQAEVWHWGMRDDVEAPTLEELKKKVESWA